MQGFGHLETKFILVRAEEEVWIGDLMEFDATFGDRNPERKARMARNIDGKKTGDSRGALWDWPKSDQVIGVCSTWKVSEIKHTQARRSHPECK